MIIPIVALVLGVLWSSTAVAAEPASPNVEVGKIEVQLFEAATGTFRPVESTEANAFGDLAVKVHLKGKGEAYLKTRKVKVEVTAGGKPVFVQERNAPGTGWQFFFYPTGLLCGELVVNVTVSGQPRPTSQRLTSQFACHE